jgi:hypothetical protein
LNDNQFLWRCLPFGLKSIQQPDWQFVYEVTSLKKQVTGDMTTMRNKLASHANEQKAKRKISARGKFAQKLGSLKSQFDEERMK